MKNKNSCYGIYCNDREAGLPVSPVRRFENFNSARHEKIKKINQQTNKVLSSEQYLKNLTGPAASGPIEICGPRRTQQPRRADPPRQRAVAEGASLADRSRFRRCSRASRRRAYNALVHFAVQAQHGIIRTKLYILYYTQTCIYT